jgi:hypothetical protein
MTYLWKKNIKSVSHDHQILQIQREKYTKYSYTANIYCDVVHDKESFTIDNMINKLRCTTYTSITLRLYKCQPPCTKQEALGCMRIDEVILCTH